MKIIAILGDSHTWGQGVGAEGALDPSVTWGDLRMTPFTYPNYVDLLRDYVNAATGSRASEYEVTDLLASGGRPEGGAAVFPEDGMTLAADFAYARLFVRVLPGAPVTLRVTLDGKALPDVSLSSESDAWNVGLFPVHLFGGTDGRHTVTVRASGDALRVYRLECYGGPYAVVNCGIGSCPVRKYLDLYYDRYIAPMKPYGVLFEGCTINDWLTKEGPAVYADLVREMLDRLSHDGARVVSHTVFPVAGPQTADDCPALYADYVEAGRRATHEAGVPLVDCYASLRAQLDALPEERRFPWLYSDRWHPNATGHYLYAKEIYPTLSRVMLTD